MRILAELTPIFPDITHRVRIERDECDLHLPSLQVAIMVDGLYYHRDRGDKDTEATARLEKAGIRVIRLRGNGLPSLGIGHNLSFTEAPAIRLSEVQALVRAIAMNIPLSSTAELATGYLLREQFWRETEYLALVAQIPGPMAESR